MSQEPPFSALQHAGSTPADYHGLFHNDIMDLKSVAAYIGSIGYNSQLPIAAFLLERIGEAIMGGMRR